MPKALELEDFGICDNADAPEVSGEMKEIAGRLMKLPYCDMRTMAEMLATLFQSTVRANPDFFAASLITVSREILKSPSPKPTGPVYRDTRLTNAR